MLSRTSVAFAQSISSLYARASYLYGYVLCRSNEGSNAQSPKLQPSFLPRCRNLTYSRFILTRLPKVGH